MGHICAVVQSLLGISEQDAYPKMMMQAEPSSSGRGQFGAT